VLEFNNYFFVESVQFKFFGVHWDFPLWFFYYIFKADGVNKVVPKYSEYRNIISKNPLTR
jgi:hypothetical protein